MMMKVLDHSFNTEVLHESDPRAFEDYEMRPPEVIHALVGASKSALRCRQGALRTADRKDVAG
jgi:hypothetical protein